MQSLHTQLSATVSSDIVVLNVFSEISYVYIQCILIISIIPPPILPRIPSKSVHVCVCVCFNLLGPISTTYVYMVIFTERGMGNIPVGTQRKFNGNIIVAVLPA